jgi:hypothetical protein
VFFLTLIVVGLAGLVTMALPALRIGGHGGTGHVAPAPSSHAAPAHAHGSTVGIAPGRGGLLTGALGFLLHPRAVFSVLAIYGAVGNAFVRAGHLAPLAAGVAAVVPALVIERFAVTPLWSLMFRYQAAPSSPLHDLLLREAKAVTPFRNGRGIVAVERDGRLVQFMARLTAPETAARVRVGETLRVDDVDDARECLVVTLRGVASAVDAPERPAAPRGQGS